MGDRIYINGEFYMGDRIMDRLAKSYIKDIVSTLDDLPIGDREAYLLALIYEMKYEEIMNQEKLDNEDHIVNMVQRVGEKVPDTKLTVSYDHEVESLKTIKKYLETKVFDLETRLKQSEDDLNSSTSEFLRLTMENVGLREDVRELKDENKGYSVDIDLNGAI